VKELNPILVLFLRLLGLEENILSLKRKSYKFYEYYNKILKEVYCE